MILFFLSYKVITTPFPKEEGLYNPYEILGIEVGMEESAIRKHYRQLSLIHHPDKVEDDKKEGAEDMFIKITKAYKVLTDEDARKMWEEFGNPDGQRSEFSLEWNLKNPEKRPRRLNLRCFIPPPTLSLSLPLPVLSPLPKLTIE